MGVTTSNEIETSVRLNGFYFEPTILSSREVKYVLKDRTNRNLSFRVFLDRLASEESDLIIAFTETLKISEFKAFFLEFPPLSLRTLNSKVPEFVLVKSNELLLSNADPSPFANYLNSCNNTAVTSFPNLRGDAYLIVPCPHNGISNQSYAHISKFVREIPAEQVNKLWQTVATQTLTRIQAAPEKALWVSTSGLGVSWLHVRLDSTPKYYNHHPYKILS